MVKNPPAMQEMKVQSLGVDHPLEEEMATHSSIPAWRIPWTDSLERCSSWGCKESDMNEGLSTERQTGRSRSLGGSGWGIEIEKPRNHW